MPPLDGATAWINSQPLKSTDLHGKVVLIEFWTYTCINWRRQFPYVRAWADKYRDKGLVVIGVHSPEFVFEKNLDNVRRLTKEIGVPFPVAVDSDHAIWRAFNNQYWPALYFVARNIGYANVEFRKGKIQNLSLDLELLDQRLKQTPVRSSEGLSALESEICELRNRCPLIADNSIDVVVSNCVLNLVRPQDKRQLFTEIFRVLRRGGRAVISDITSDEDIPEELQRNPELWSGCISGAFREDLFLQAFEEVGFYGVTILERQAEPWRTIEGIEFRSMTVAAYKGKEGPCWDQKHAVIYRGPFRQVEDDDGHVLKRGVRTAVCEKTYRIYSQEPYQSQFELVPPRVPVPLEEARPFPCSRGYLRRDPKETKGADYRVTTEAQATCCAPSNGNGGCC